MWSAALLAAQSALAASGASLTVTLPGALFLRDAPIPDGPTLVLDVTKSRDHWERVWGFAGDFHINSPHPGRVVAGQITDDQISLRLEMDIQSGSWARGGRAHYEMDLKRLPDGAYAGTYTGAFRGVPVSGQATAARKPQPSALPTGFVTPQPGEHPRLLFRKSELAALREKAKTPLGEAALARMGWSNQKESDVVGLGVKYQLTGDRTFAAEAIPGVEKLMAGWLHCDQYGNNVGDRAAKMALAFDLCYGAWPADFKRRVRRYLLFVADNVWHHHKKMHQGINWHFCSNWSAPIHSGIGIAGLALWGEPGAEPLQPPAPHCGADIPPATDYRPGNGVPVVRFQSDEMPNDWLCLSPLPWEETGDPLAALGGAAQARPELGTKVTFAGQTQAFRRLTRETNGGYWAHTNYTRGKDALDITVVSRPFRRAPRRRLRQQPRTPEDVPWNPRGPYHPLDQELQYTRTIVFVKHPRASAQAAGPLDYVVIRDQASGPMLNAAYCLHVESKECRQDGPRFTFGTMTLFCAAPREFKVERLDWSFRKKGRGGGGDSGYGERTVGVRLLTTGAKHEFVTVLYPAGDAPDMESIPGGVRAFHPSTRASPWTPHSNWSGDSRPQGASVFGFL